MAQSALQAVAHHHCSLAPTERQRVVVAPLAHAALAQSLEEPLAVGRDGFNRVWDKAENLPSRDEVLDPDAWCRRVAPDLLG